MIFNLKKYQLASGKIPFDDWLGKVSPVFRARIYANLARVEIGNWGNVKPIQGGNAKELYELRMFFGPGYRAYFGKDTALRWRQGQPTQGYSGSKKALE